MGYLFAQQHRGQCFAAKAAKVCLHYGFEKLGFREIIAITDLDHVASQKVWKKFGFEKRGIENIEGEDNLVYIARNSGILNE